jgi:hypothetical protein
MRLDSIIEMTILTDTVLKGKDVMLSNQEKEEKEQVGFVR